MNRFYFAIASLTLASSVGCTTYRQYTPPPSYYGPPAGAVYAPPAYGNYGSTGSSGCASCGPTARGMVVAPRYTPPFAAPPPPRSVEPVPSFVYNGFPPAVFPNNNNSNFGQPFGTAPAQGKLLIPRVEEESSFANNGKSDNSAAPMPKVEPGVSGKSSTGPMELPVSIPDFNIVSENISSGKKPFSDGYDWLKSNNFTQLLWVRNSGQNDDSIRADAEKRGIKVTVLDVNPQTLTKETVERFSQLVAAGAATEKVFVLDDQGKTAGTLWYLHFRMTENLPESVARARAVRLGMPEQPTGEDNALWQAATNVLVR